MTLATGWDTSADYETLTFRPDQAELFPWEVVCLDCRITHYFRLPGCPDPNCVGHKPL